MESDLFDDKHAPENYAAETEGKPPDSNRPPSDDDVVDASKLWEAIENERMELQEIAAMLHCLGEVLLYSDDDDGTMHADVAKVSRRLLLDVIERLKLLPGTFRLLILCSRVML